MSRKRRIYVAIMVASKKGQGLHLTADEVYELSQDDAIFHRAGNTLFYQEYQREYKRQSRGGNPEDLMLHIDPYEENDESLPENTSRS
jgi:hypothetical protein